MAYGSEKCSKRIKFNLLGVFTCHKQLLVEERSNILRPVSVKSVMQDVYKDSSGMFNVVFS